MTRLADEPDISDLAKALGLAEGGDCVEAVLALCRRRLDRWVEEAGGVRTIEQLESIVTARLQMVFEEIRDDADFDRIKQVYAVGKRDFVFATIRQRFDDPTNPTYGALLRRKNAAANAPDRYVAVIDCRGEKLARRFFTRWHEIAHRLTTDADPDEPVYRSEHDPIERLMDRIASHSGFYEPFLVAAYDRALREMGCLCFEAIDWIRLNAFSDASFQSTLYACHRRYDRPAVYLEAAPAHKAKHQRAINQGAQWLFDDARPSAELRAITVVPNDVANRRGLFIAPNMRVPECSLIHRIFSDSSEEGRISVENLKEWEHSGGHLADQDVRIEARRMKDRVIALVQSSS